jgi:hypothetical protein
MQNNMEVIIILIGMVAFGSALMWLTDFLLKRGEKKYNNYMSEKMDREYKESEEKRKALQEKFFNTPLSRIGMNLTNGETAYTEAITHWSWHHDDRFSKDRAMFNINNPSMLLFEDETGIFHPRQSIQSFFIDETDWYMDYNFNKRKKENI